MEMPRPTQNHDKLAALAGTWDGEEKMLPSAWDPKESTARGVIESRVALDGMFLINEYRQERDGRVTYRGHGVYGWDQKLDAFTMHWFDSMGSVPHAPAVGRWEGDSLIFESTGEKERSRYAYRFLGEGKYEFTISRSPDGRTWKNWLESTWTRR